LICAIGLWNAAKIPFSWPCAAQNECLKFNQPFEKGKLLIGVKGAGDA
jgi:hypothetical protein